jgi:signal transduction histidine kinase
VHGSGPFFARRASWPLLLAVSLALGIAGLVLTFWFFGFNLLLISPGGATMKPVTAIAFILSASAILLHQNQAAIGERRMLSRLFWGRLLALLVLLLGLESTIEAVFQIDLGLNELLFHQSMMATHSPHPGRMSPATAWCFVGVGTALLGLDKVTSRKYYPADFLTLAVAFTGILCVSGYIYGGKGLTDSKPFQSMALLTGALFVILAAGIFLLRPDRGLASVILSKQPGGWMARRILPITSTLPFIIGFLRNHGEAAGLYSREMGFACFAVANISMMAVIIWTNARSLNRLSLERDEREREADSAAEDLARINMELEAEILRRQTAQDLLRLANDTLEAKVEERTAKLQDANRELESFSYSVSHDLRAPLRAIDGFSRILSTTIVEKLSPDERQLLERICLNSERMGRLIDDLLSFSRLARGQLKYTEIDLSAMAQQIFDDLKKIQPDRGVQIVIESGLNVWGDETLLRVVMENLLGNAWKFTRKNPAARIDFFRKEGTDSVFQVRDNGAGFSMLYADQLFSPFQRLHRVEDFEGNGIGLASVRRILVRHGGWIEVEAKVNEGACFSFFLPERNDSHSEMRSLSSLIN